MGQPPHLSISKLHRIISRTRLFTGIPPFRLFYQFNKTAEFRFRSRSVIQKFFELFLGQVRLQVGHHIERLPPAIEYLKAGPGFSTASSAVVKGNRPAQPRTSSFEMIFAGYHIICSSAVGVSEIPRIPSRIPVSLLRSASDQPVRWQSIDRMNSNREAHDRLSLQ